MSTPNLRQAATAMLDIVSAFTTGVRTLRHAELEYVKARAGQIVAGSKVVPEAQIGEVFKSLEALARLAATDHSLRSALARRMESDG
jgi:hypothetical protein